MKYVTLLILCIASGCASNQTANTESAAPAPRYYAPAAASALAFDPPIAAQTPMPDLDRSGRSPGAFAGYEQTVTTYYSLDQRDQIRNYTNNGQFERNAYTDTVSVTSR